MPRLNINSFGQVTPGNPNRLRADPDTSSATIGSIPGGGVFYVLDGPVCADEILYWLVDYDGSVGWAGEGSNGVYWADPYFKEGEPVNTAELSWDYPRSWCYSRKLGVMKVSVLSVMTDSV